jgi:hypothetical protein
LSPDLENQHFGEDNNFLVFAKGYFEAKIIEEKLEVCSLGPKKSKIPIVNFDQRGLI